MRFAHPAALLLLLLIPASCCSWAGRGAARDRVSDQRRAARLRPSFAAPAARRPALAARAGPGLAVLALAGPQWGVETTRALREGIAIAMVIDTSSSMSAIDLRLDDRPSDRLEVVKAAFREFVTGGASGVEGRGSDAIGMVTFARYADNISPPTLDHEALLGLLDQVRIVELPTEDGTAIGDAIVRAIDMLQQAGAVSKVIILLTDGSYNAGEVEPLVAAQVAGARHQDLCDRGRHARHGARPGRGAGRPHRVRVVRGEHRRNHAHADRAADRRQVLPGDRRRGAARDLRRDRPPGEGRERGRAPAALRRDPSADHRARPGLLLLEVVLVTTRLRAIPRDGAIMRFAAWPAAYLMVLVPAMLALFAYAFRRRRLALAEFVTGELGRGCCRPATGAPGRGRSVWPPPPRAWWSR